MVGVVLIAGCITALQVGKVPAASPLLTTSLGLGVGQIGWLSAAVALFGVIGSLPAGGLVAAIGAKRVLAGGLAALTVGAALGMHFDSFALLLVGRLIEGIGFLCVIVAGPSAIDRLATGRTRDLVYAAWSCSVPVGLAIAFVAAPQFTSWAAIAWATALLSLLALAAVLLILRPDTVIRHVRFNFADSMRMVLKERGAKVLGMVFLLYNLMFFVMFSFLPLLVVQQLQLDAAMAGTLSGFACAANAVGNLAAGALLARCGPPLIVAAAATVMTACGIGVFLPVFTAWPTLGLCIAFSAVGGLLPATALATVPRVSRTPSQVPLTLAALMQGSNIGQVIAPVSVGVLVQAAGWAAAAGAIVMAGLLLLVCSHALRRTLVPTRGS